MNLNMWRNLCREIRQFWRTVWEGRWLPLQRREESQDWSNLRKKWRKPERLDSLSFIALTMSLQNTLELQGRKTEAPVLTEGTSGITWAESWSPAHVTKLTFLGNYFTLSISILSLLHATNNTKWYFI